MAARYGIYDVTPYLTGDKKVCNSQRSINSTSVARYTAIHDTTLHQHSSKHSAKSHFHDHYEYSCQSDMDTDSDSSTIDEHYQDESDEMYYDDAYHYPSEDEPFCSDVTKGSRDYENAEKILDDNQPATSLTKKQTSESDQQSDTFKIMAQDSAIFSFGSKTPASPVKSTIPDVTYYIPETTHGPSSYSKNQERAYTDLTDEYVSQSRELDKNAHEGSGARKVRDHSDFTTYCQNDNDSFYNDDDDFVFNAPVVPENNPPVTLIKEHDYEAFHVTNDENECHCSYKPVI